MKILRYTKILFVLLTLPPTIYENLINIKKTVTLANVTAVAPCNRSFTCHTNETHTSSSGLMNEPEAQTMSSSKVFNNFLHKLASDKIRGHLLNSEIPSNSLHFWAILMTNTEKVA
ncbi:hypothetical protein GQ457_03G034680 [Hibiscus cannabinus]